MTASQRSLDIVRDTALAIYRLKGENVVALDVSANLPIADAFVIASGSNERQVAAIADAVMDELLKAGVKAIRREGIREGRWALIDFNDVIVHIMHEEERTYYALERLWKDCPVLELPEDGDLRDGVLSSFESSVSVDAEGAENS